MRPSKTHCTIAISKHSDTLLSVALSDLRLGEIDVSFENAYINIMKKNRQIHPNISQEKIIVSDISQISSTKSIAILLFGFTGHLSRTKIIPSLWYLYERGFLDHNLIILGVGRRQLNEQELSLFVEDSISSVVTAENIELIKQFSNSIKYIAGEIDKDDLYVEIRHLLKKIKPTQLMVYFATLPKLYASLIFQLKHHCFSQFESCQDTRLLIEKPLGHDTKSASIINAQLSDFLPEAQLYRVDHYLAKETVQNIIAFRFANGVFEHLWSAKYIEAIHLTYAETNGVEGREEFFADVGILRDVVQNHILQLLSLILMEEPKSLDAKNLQFARAQALANLRVFSHEEAKSRIRFGIYENANLKKKTSTAVALKLEMENQRWHGLPIYIRAGKKLSASVTEVKIVFKEPLNSMFKSLGRQEPNVLTLRIQPNESISFQLQVKKPGLDFQLDQTNMDFCYHTRFGKDSIVQAYSKVLYDALNGSSSVFLDSLGSDASWRVIEPFLDLEKSSQIATYKQFSWGPASFSEIYSNKNVWIEPDMSLCSF